MRFSRPQGQTFRVVAIAIALAAMSRVSASNLQSQAVGTGVVAGQVIDATSKRPVGGAVVTLAAAAPAATGANAGAQPPVPVAQARRTVAVANSEGRFVFRDVPAGSYVLTVMRNGYAPGGTGRRRPDGPLQTFKLDEGQRLIDAVVSLWRLSTISGIVRDDRGEPVVGVSVSVLRRTLTGGRYELSFTGGGGESTDDRGRYRVSGLMPGSYVVNVRTSTQSAAVPTVDAYRAAVTSGTAGPMTQQWGETGALRMSTEGLVVDGWQVAVSIGMPQPLPGKDGRLLIHPSTFSGNTSSPMQASVLTLAPGEDRVGVDLTLPLVDGVRVSGVLTGPDGPAANHGVRLVPAAVGDQIFDVPVAYSTTDQSGRFSLLGVAPGAYVLRAYRVPQSGPVMRPPPPPAAGAVITRGAEPVVAPPAGPPAPSLFAELPVTVGSAHISDLDVVLQPGARLSGRIAFEGAAPAPAVAQLARVAVTLRPLTGTVPAGTSRVDWSGTFDTSGYAPGRYHVNVTSPGPEWTLASVRVAGVDVAGQAFMLGTSDERDVVVTFTDKVTTISGTVRAAESGGDADATVVVFPADGPAWLASGMSPRRTAIAPTSATGTYQVRMALPGDYMVVAVPSDVAPDVTPEFVAKFAASAVRVSLALGDAKVQALTVGRPR